MKKYLNLYKSKFCSLLWLLLGLEALVVIYLLSPAPIDPLVVIEPNFATLQGDNLLYEEGKPARYIVSVSKNLDKELRVELSYEGGAVRGVDYEAPSFVVIKKGDMNTTFEITARDDNELEGEELIAVKISKISGKNFMEPLQPQDLGGVVYTKLLDEPKHLRQLHKPALISVTCNKNLSEDNATASCTLRSAQKSYEPLQIVLAYAGSATKGVDFSAKEQITLPQGKSEVSFNIQAIDDAYIEGVETIEVSVVSVTGGGFEEYALDHKVGTIELSDEASSRQVTALSVNNIEKIEEGGKGKYTLQLSREPISDVTVYLKRNEGAKKFDVPEKVIFHKGEKEKHFNVVSRDDNIKENVDFIDFAIAKVEQASFEKLSYANSAVKTKVVDEAVPVEPDSDTAFITLSTENNATSFDETAGDVSIIITTSQPLEKETHFWLKLEKTSAQGREYRLQKSVSIKKGERSGRTLLHITDNNIKQDEDRFTISVYKHDESGLEDLRSKEPLTLSIVDDNSGNKSAHVALSCPKRLYENDKTISCKVTMSQRAFEDVVLKLDYSGSATYGVDYIGVKELTLAKGKKVARFKITSIDDTQKEGSERIVPTIVSTQQNYFEQLNIIDNNSSIALVDEKKASKIVYLELHVLKEVIEGETTPMKLTLSEPAFEDVTVYLKSPKSRNYEAVEKVSIAKGERGVTFNVPTTNDNIKEYNSYLPVSIVKVAQEGFEHLSFDKRQHRVLIVDDNAQSDAAHLKITADHNRLYEDDKEALFSLVLSQPTQKTMNISLKSSGAAKQGQDYTMPQSLQIKKDETVAKVSIKILNDNIVEAPESIKISVAKYSDGGLEQVRLAEDLELMLHDDKEPKNSPVARLTLRGPSQVAEPKASLPYTLSLTQKAEETMVVYLAYGGEATAQDYKQVSQVQIAKGKKSAHFKIETIDNEEIQSLRQFTIKVKNIESGGLENVAIEEKVVKTKITDNADIDKAFESIVKDQVIKFEIGSVEVGENAKQTLDKIAELFVHFPSARLTVEGHTNNLGSANFNLVLSQKRANSIKRYLVSKGIKANRIRAIGYGETRPLLDDNSKEAMEFNKRVEFKVVY